MDSDYFAKEYFIENLSPNISDVLVTKGTQLNSTILEGIVNELIARNKDLDSIESLGKAALALGSETLVKARMIAQKQKQESEFKEAVVRHFSQDFSENISLFELVQLLVTPSINRIVFKPKKESNPVREFLQRIEHNKDHYYAIEREADTVLNLYSETCETPHISMVFDNVPSFRPSQEITKNFLHTNQKWPYPVNGEMSYYAINDHRFGATIAKYFPNLKWGDIHLHQGKFDSGLWTLFFSILNNNSYLYKGISLLEIHKRNLMRISESFVTPHGMCTLEIGDVYKEHTNYKGTLFNSIDVHFKYIEDKDSYHKAGLYFRDASLTHGFDSSKMNIDTHAF